MSGLTAAMRISTRPNVQTIVAPVVVFDRSGRQEEEVEHHSQQRHAPQLTFSQAAKHLDR